MKPTAYKGLINITPQSHKNKNKNKDKRDTYSNHKPIEKNTLLFYYLMKKD